MAAGLFALHPVHVESVAWISAINDPLYGFFTLAGLIAFVRWRDRGSRGLPLLAALCLALGLASKELAIALVPLALAFDFGRRDDTASSPLSGQDAQGHPWWRGYLPFAAVLVAYYGARVFAFESAWAGFDRTSVDFGVGWLREQMLRIEVLGGALQLLAWPLQLNLFRAFRPTIPLSDPEFLRAVVFLLLTAAATALAWRRRAWPELTLLLFLPATLLPLVVRFESLGAFPLAERFLYVPAFASCALLCALARRFVSLKVGAVGLGSLLLFYGARSWTRIEFWSDEETLYREAALQTPRSPSVLWGLGRVLLERHQEGSDPAYLAEAFEVYEQAGKLLEEAKRPDTDIMVTSGDYAQVNLGLGWCYLFEARADSFGGFGTPIAIFERIAKAMGDLMDRTQEARELGINVRAESYPLDEVYGALGQAKRLAGDFAGAEAALKRAVSFNENSPTSHAALAKLYAERQSWISARRHFERALALRPDHFPTEVGLTQVLFSEGRVEEAKRRAIELAERFPDEAEPLVIQAAASLQKQDARAALTLLDRALALDPNHGYAWYQKGKALVLAGLNDQATLQAFRKAAELLPTNFEANYDFGAYLLASGAQDAALPFLVRAYGLAPEERLLLALFQQLSEFPFPDATSPLQLARIEQQRGRLDLAERWLDKARESAPDDARVALERGLLMRQLERQAEALADLRRAAELAPTSFRAHVELGAFLVDLGQREEAREVLERALSLEIPADPGIPELKVEAERRVRQLLDEVAALEARVGPQPAESQ